MMKFILLILFILSIYPSELRWKPNYGKKKLQFKVNQTEFSKDTYALYQALTTGNKKNLSRKIKTTFKKYGIIHLLTPSGVHLSSIMFLFNSVYFLELVFIIISLIFLKNYQGYDSLERVLIFRFLGHSILKNQQRFKTELSFILTILLSFSIGHFTSISLSLIYSLAFWGTIIIYRKNSVKMLVYMNIMLYFMASFSASTHSLFSIIINPLLTSMMTMAFPLLILNTLLPTYLQMNQITDFFLKFFLEVLYKIESIDFFPLIGFSTLSVLIFILLLQFINFKTAILYLCLFSSPAHKSKNIHLPKSYTNLAVKENFKTMKNNWHYGETIKCKSRELVFYCKKKTLRKKGSLYHF